MNKEPSNRQLKVGEELRRALADFFTKSDDYKYFFKGVSISVSEVRISPDFRNAAAFINVVGGGDLKELLAFLNGETKEIGKVIYKKIPIRNFPRIYFKADESSSNSSKINDILTKLKAEKND